MRTYQRNLGRVAGRQVDRGVRGGVASDSSCCTSSLPCCAAPGDLDLRLGVAAPEGEGSRRAGKGMVGPEACHAGGRMSGQLGPVL
jgi:hypothetical protein